MENFKIYICLHSKPSKVGNVMQTKIFFILRPKKVIILYCVALKVTLNKKF